MTKTWPGFAFACRLSAGGTPAGAGSAGTVAAASDVAALVAPGAGGLGSGVAGSVVAGLVAVAAGTVGELRTVGELLSGARGGAQAVAVSVHAATITSAAA